jgi:hypothetical protein
MRAATVAGQGAPGMSTKMAILRSTRTGTRLRACADRLATFHTCRFSERLNGLLISLCYICYPPIRAASYSGSYSLVWELHVEGLRLHTGGELKKVSGVVQNAYARLSPASL